MKFELPKYKLREFNLRRIFVQRVRDLKLNQFHDTGFIAHHPRNDLPGVFPVFGFDDRPGTMYTNFAAPFKLMQEAG